MGAGDDDVFAPEDDLLGVEEVEEVVAVFFAKVEELSGVASARADVATFAGHRAKELEVVIA